MPWTANSATKHTRKANTAKRKSRWSAVANDALRRGASEGSAVRQANAVVAGTANRGGGRPGGRRKRMAGKYSMPMRGGKKAPIKSPMRKVFGKGVKK